MRLSTSITKKIAPLTLIYSTNQQTKNTMKVHTKNSVCSHKHHQTKSRQNTGQYTPNKLNEHNKDQVDQINQTMSRYDNQWNHSRNHGNKLTTRIQNIENETKTEVECYSF